MILAIAATFVAGTITTSALIYADSGDGSIIHACVSNSGQVRLVAPFETCKKSEDPLHWGIVGPTGPAGADQSAQIAALQARVDALELLTASMTADSSNVFFTGVNVRIRDGTGTTACAGPCNGLGNLIVGYDEGIGTKSGSHNHVIGSDHSYVSYGGLVAGKDNTISGPFSTVSGGNFNAASGPESSVSGGAFNTASGFRSSVSGGSSNIASGLDVSSVSGGRFNTASGDFSSVSGGRSNTASGTDSSVSGGAFRSAIGDDDWVAGTLFETVDFLIPDFIKEQLYAILKL